MGQLWLPNYEAYTKQPQEAVDIDWGGLGKGMQMLLMQQGGRLVDLVNPHVAWAPVNGATSAPTTAGVASSFNGTASRVFQATGYASMGGVNGTFFLWMPRFGAYDIAGSIFLSTPSADLYVQLTPDGRVFLTGAQATGAPNIANTRNCSVVFSSRASQTAVMFNGVERVSNVNNRIVNAGTKTLNFGGYTGGTDWDTDADIVIAGYTSEAWTEAQARAFHENPWQLFRQKVNIPLDVTVRENRKPVIRESNLLGTSKRKLSDVNVLKGEAIEKVLSKQPQYATGINWSNPLSSGLVFGYSAAADYDFLGRVPTGVTSSGSGQRTPGTVGIGKLQDATRAARFLRLPNITNSPNATVLVLFQRTGTVGQWARLFDTKQGSQGLTIFLNSAGAGQNLISCTASAAAAGHDLSATLTDSSKPTLVVFSVADALARIYESNIQIASSISGGGTLQQNTANSILFGSENASSIVSPFNGVIYLLCVWDRTLSPIEVRNLSTNPWQLFKNQSQLILPK